MMISTEQFAVWWETIIAALQIVFSVYCKKLLSVKNQDRRNIEGPRINSNSYANTLW